MTGQVVGGVDFSTVVTPQGAAAYAYNSSALAEQIPGGGSVVSALVAGALNWNSLDAKGKMDAMVQTTAAAVALVPVVGLIMSGLLEGEWALANALMGDQGSKCGTDKTQPYGGYDSSVFSYANLVGPYTPAAPGTFEEFAQSMIVADFDSNNDCWNDARARMPLILALAIQAWNASHSSDGSPAMSGGLMGLFSRQPVQGSGGTLTFTFMVNNPWMQGGTGSQWILANPNFGWPESTNPIAVALNVVASIGHTNLAPFGQHEDPNPIAQPSAMSFTVNNGPAIPAQVAPPPLPGGGDPLHHVVMPGGPPKIVLTTSGQFSNLPSPSTAQPSVAPSTVATGIGTGGLVAGALVAAVGFPLTGIAVAAGSALAAVAMYVRGRLAP